MDDQDYLYALRLQKELDEVEDHGNSYVDNNKRKRDESDLNATQNIVHPQWEEIDPTPDIHSLFGAFDLKFFRGKLKCVVLEWSKKMFRCAGICYQRRNAMGMSITIRLSEPLLKLRTRRNLIETLLHEMIHAYLFVSNIREPNGGHGPNFNKLMTDINKVAGTNITVYHSFHEEVATYQTHIWRCNGICQHRKPFYGWVKRTRNLAPSHRDLWFAKHHETCGGTFQKVSEPEPKSKSKKAKISHAVENLPKIKDFLNSKDNNSSKKLPNTPRNPLGGYTKINGGGTIVIKPTTQNRGTSIANNDDTPNKLNSDATRRTAAGGNLNNVIGFRDLNSSGSGNSIKNPLPTGRGTVLGSSGSRDTQQSDRMGNPTEQIRSVWANRFNNPSPKTCTATSARGNNLTTKINVTEATSNWEEIDVDILIRSVQDAIVEIDDDSDTETDITRPKRFDNANASLTQKSIKEELLDDLGENSDAIEMIDDEFDENLNASLEILTDASVIQDIFGIDDLLANFNEINGVVMKFPENKGDPNKEIISCPICQDSLPRDELSEHLDGCTGITVKIEKKKRNVDKAQALPFYKNQAKPSTSTSTSRKVDDSLRQEMLRNAGYDQETIDRLFTETPEAKNYNERISREMHDEQRNETNDQQQSIDTIAIPFDDDDLAPQNDVTREKVTCPVCNTLVYSDLINQHLDDCLKDC